jgi:small-conductance mechanosensitive channel
MLRNGALSRLGMLVVGILLPCLALAQIPLTFPPGDKAKHQASKAESKFDPKEARGRIEQELAKLRVLLDRIQSGKEPPAPPGITPAEVAEGHKTYATLSFLLEGQRDTVRQLDESGKALQAAEKASKGWAGFADEQKPYSILLKDTIQEEVDSHQAAVELLKSSRGLLEVELDRFRDKAVHAQEAARRAAEAVEGAAPGSDAHAAEAWRLDAAREQARLAGEFLALGTLARREFEEKLAVAQTQLQLAQRKYADLADNVTITKANVEEARRRLESLRDQREKELQSLLELSRRRLWERDIAARELEAIRSADIQNEKSPEREQERKLADARFRAADVRVHSLGQQIRILTVLVNIYHSMAVSSWELRYAILTGEDPDARQKARQQLAETTTYLKAWNSRATIQLNASRSAIREQDQRVQAATDTPSDTYERQALDALRQVERALERQQTIVARRLARLGHWEQEFSTVLRQQSLRDVAAELWARLSVGVQHVWDYELLTFEDKVEVGGKVVTTSRGVTVGKSIGAIVLFLLGLRLLALFSAQCERLLVRRFGVGEEQGKTLRRWANALGMLALLLLTLNIARIPLTVFAFAGGALAIGIGFGMQTLIKNLISGMIVLLERQVRVGDVVQVEGVTGIVSAVNIRSSTVRGFDGVESMVPNSILLEQKVTNWTLSNKRLRRFIRVGVAYGSPVREVERILVQCAQAHQKVLQQPPPWVVLDDFGSDALVFVLYFWLDFISDEDLQRNLGEVRSAIEECFAEAGVSIAFPQRDVHIDASKALRVEVVASGARAV